MAFWTSTTTTSNPVFNTTTSGTTSSSGRFYTQGFPNFAVEHDGFVQNFSWDFENKSWTPSGQGRTVFSDIKISVPEHDKRKYSDIDLMRYSVDLLETIEEETEGMEDAEALRKYIKEYRKNIYLKMVGYETE